VDGRDAELGSETPDVPSVGELWIDRRLVDQDRPVWADSAVAVGSIFRPWWLLGGGGGFLSLQLGGLVLTSGDNRNV
jgi:hypothetical protein